MSGTDEVRESVWLMWHCAATDRWNPRLVMPWILTLFFCKNHKPLWCRDVLWIVLWCCLLFTEKAEVQKSVLSLAMEGFAQVSTIGHGVGMKR